MLHRHRLCLLALPLLALTACELDGRSTVDLGIVAPPSLRLELRGDDRGNGSAGIEGLTEAVAIVHAAAAHVAGSGWHTIMEGRVEVDFLRLADHAADLGIANIPAGKVTQIRLYVLEDEEAYVTDTAGARHPLLTPSGSQSGIKVKGNWSIGECESGTLVLSTNGKKAIHIHGRGADDSYILRPVIRADRFDAAPIDGCVPGGGDGTPGGDDGTPGGDDGDGDGDGTPGGDDGDGTPGGDDGDGDEGGCYNPEGGECVGGGGSTGGDTGAGGDGNDAVDPDGSGGTGSGDGTGTGTGGTGSGGTGSGDGTGTGTGDTGAGGTGSGDGTGSGTGDTGSGGSGGSGGGSGGESELCYNPEAGGFYDC